MRALVFCVMLLTACDDDAQPPANADLSADLSASSDLSAASGDLSIAPDLEHSSGLDVDAGTLAIPKTGPAYTGPHTSPAFGGVCPDETLEPNGDPSQAVSVPPLTVDAVAPKIVHLAIC